MHRAGAVGRGRADRCHARDDEPDGERVAAADALAEHDAGEGEERHEPEREHGLHEAHGRQGQGDDLQQGAGE